jgi:hypothetical protein
MVNKNYVSGRRKEYKIRKDKLNEGFDYSQRTAGSHSEFDIISINIDKKLIVLTQAKPNSMSETEKEKIKEKIKRFDGFYSVITELL